jgi:hypothetical protein
MPDSLSIISFIEDGHFLIFINYHSKFTWYFPTKQRSEVYAYLKIYGETIYLQDKAFQSGQGGENKKLNS